MNTPRKRAQALVGLSIITVFFGIATGAFHAKAEDQPTPEDYANLSDIQQNQKVLEDNRPAYEAFLAAKKWNEAETSELAKNGWCPVWNEDPSKITLERCSFKSGPTTPEKIVNVSYTPSKVTENARELLTGPCNGDEKCICINNAIFKHDSSWATAGVGKRALNPCNMRVPGTWKPSVSMRSINSVNGVFARFDSLEDGVTACVELWQRLYKDLPADKLVSRWTDGGGNTHYRSAVRSCYDA